jgi:dethiobiotin synthetase
MKAYFISGTGTGVGKTRFTAKTAQLALSLGLKTAVMKPVQTGVSDIESGDLGEIRRTAPGLLALPRELACPYLLKFEASPHLAAECENVEIDIARIERAVDEIRRVHKPDLLLLEGAGGVRVPISRSCETASMMARLGFPAIVVGDARLGTINHTLLTVDWLRLNGVEVAGVAINRMPDEPGPVEKDNLRCVEEGGKLKILAILPEGDASLDFVRKEGLEELLKS